jgi:hypothetical protein
LLLLASDGWEHTVRGLISQLVTGRHPNDHGKRTSRVHCLRLVAAGTEFDRADEHLRQALAARLRRLLNPNNKQGGGPPKMKKKLSPMLSLKRFSSRSQEKEKNKMWVNILHRNST